MKYSIILFTICLVLAVATATSATALASKKRSLIIRSGGWISSRAVNGFVKRAKQNDNNNKDEKKNNNQDNKNNKNNGNNDTGKGKTVDAQITFYDGQSLKNSACYGINGIRSYDANENDMIAAMHMNELELCYECIEIRNPENNNSIIVKVIDKCAGCPPNANNVDLTPGAFQQMADPNAGRVNVEWRPLDKCPDKGRWPIFEELDKHN
ncbi:hypothetical protein RclHR1_05270010 [Rhizophagus clarus]|uniref:RlpA-like protein double-psi beta-barrel domain-containing protein n=1 Tax=Rhizophagus clarus TaxID=94130 RepID=A0A2Z6RN58_9GLOM|nr:hypothetical protein RclHR1_05270010 [Rhizophagus clarus]